MTEGDFDTLFEQARDQLRRGRLDAGAELLRAAVAVASNDPGQRIALGMALLEAGVVDLAAEQFETGLNGLPPNAQLWYEVGNALERAEGRDHAQAAYRRAGALDPNHVDARVALGLSLVRQGRSGDAATAFEAALEISPQHAEALIQLAMIRRAAAPPPAPRPSIPAARSFEGSEPPPKPASRVAPRETRPAEFVPYRGAGEAPTILVLLSAMGGNVRTEHTLTDDRFSLLRIQVEYWDPAKTAALPPYDVVFNGIGEADINPGSLETAISLLQPVTAPVVNRPEIVLGTGRRDIPGRLAGLDGVIVPATEVVTRAMLSSPDAAALLADLGFQFPLLVRPPGFHSGQHFHKIDNPDELRVPLRDGPFNEFLVTQYIDYRNADGQFRKYRLLFIDGELYPYHLAISDHWKIHYFSALMAGNPANKAEEQRFLMDMTGALGAKAVAGLRGIQARMGLDYCGIDCSLSPEGDVIVFETNATMLIHSEESETEFAYRHRHVATLVEAFRGMFDKRAGMALR